MKNTNDSGRRYVWYEIILLFVLSLMFASCQAQVESKQIKKDISEIEEFPFFKPKIDTNDIDPYFTENNYLITEHGPQSITRNIIQDKTGTFWFATWHGIMSYDGKVFTNHTNQSGLRRYRAFCLMEDGENIWFGTRGAGLYKYDGSGFTNITTKDGLGSDELECMIKDKDGKIWLGTEAGVSVYDGEQFQNYTLKDGLLDADIHDITQDKSGKIWVASSSGICIYDPAVQGIGQGAFRELKNEEGNSFNNVRTIIEDREGGIWFGGNDGLTYFNNNEFFTLTEDFVGYLYEDKKGDIWFNKPTANGAGEMGLFRYSKGPLPHHVSLDNMEQIHQEDDMIFGIMEDSDGNIWYGRGGGITRYDGKSFEYFR